MKSRQRPRSPARATQSCGVPMEACRAICSMVPDSCGIARKGFEFAGRRALVVGCGGVGSDIAASLAAAGIATIGLFDTHAPSAEELGSRLRSHYPALAVTTGSNDPANFDLVVNATPMGMNDGDLMPMDLSRIATSMFVGEVVM